MRATIPLVAFAEFYATLVKLQPNPQKRGKELFEPVCKWYLQNDPLYAHELKQVWLWKDWPGRWKESEAGIDLVGETHDGKLWAIQAKDYSQPLPKTEMDKFLSESARKGTEGNPLFAYRLLITTAPDLCFNAQDITEASFIPVGTVIRNKLEAAQINWPASFADMYAIPQPEPKSPFPYQEKAINDVLNGFSKFDRGQMIMPCATGKTLTSLFIREEMKAGSTLFCVPNLQLLGQTAREWLANRKADFRYKPVCSSKSVIRDDEIVENASDLGFPVTTNADEIADFLRQDSLLPAVVLTTYQSMAEVSKALHQDGVPPFDLVVADEAHRTAGPLGAEFAMVLDNEKIPAKKRLFMTATPKAISAEVQKDAEEKFDFKQASMDNEVLYGPQFYELTYQEAKLLGRVSDYEVNVILVKEDDPTYLKYLQWAVNRNLVRVDDSGKVTDASKVALQIALIKAIKEHGLRRVIAFFSRVKPSREFAETLTDVIPWLNKSERPTAKVWVKHMDGTQPAGDRNRVLQKLRNVAEDECGVVTNARCLTEGIDVPALDGEVFVDPKRSVIDIVQAVGRVFRVAPGKDKGHIIIPVFVKAEDNLEMALQSSPFQPVWDVLWALRDHDVRLGEMIDDYRFLLAKLGKGPKGPQKLPDQIKIDLGHLVGEKFAQAFALKLAEQTCVLFKVWCKVLEQFVEEHGHASPLASYVTDEGWRLGSFVNTQRTWKKKGWLKPDRVTRLEQFHGWSWDAHNGYWLEGLRRLRDYVDKTGALPARDVVVDGFPLGQWTSNQHRRIKNPSFPVDRAQLLKEVPGWDCYHHEEAWNRGLRELRNYRDREGNTLVKATYKTDDGFPLGTWVNKQRSTYLKDPENFPAHRVGLLQSVDGWVWDAREAHWQDNFKRLQRWADKTGHANPPVGTEFEGYPIGNWAATQRAFYRKGKLSDDHAKQLKEIPKWSWKLKPGHRSLTCV